MIKAIKLPNVPDSGCVGHYDRDGIFGAEDVFSLLRAGEKSHVFNNDEIKLSGNRYALFALQHICVECGLEGLYFAKERAVVIGKHGAFPVTTRYHLNLYGRNPNGREIMLTRDHRFPKAHGGSDELDNLQTMCAVCNFRKRDRLPHETPEAYALRRKTST